VNKKGLLLGAVALVSLALGSVAHAMPLTYDFTGIVIRSTGSSGTAVGNAITGSFSYDPDAYSFGSVSYSVQTGSFAISHSAYFQLHNLPSEDAQFLDDALPGIDIQSGLFFGDITGTTLSDTEISSLNWNLAAWTYRQVRYNLSDAGGIITDGWTGDLTSITQRVTSVAEPSPFVLLGIALAVVGFARRLRLSGRG
jgi:hypothetical protein